MIIVSIWILICCFAYFVYGQVQFYVLAICIGFVMGGIQSNSRSSYAKLCPNDEKDLASFFSFYDVTEKVGLIIGLVSFGFIDGHFSMRYSILALIVFFAIAFGLMFMIPKSKAEV